jgi:hypothetical protein
VGLAQWWGWGGGSMVRVGWGWLNGGGGVGSMVGVRVAQWWGWGWGINGELNGGREAQGFVVTHPCIMSILPHQDAKKHIMNLQSGGSPFYSIEGCMFVGRCSVLGGR